MPQITSHTDKLQRRKTDKRSQDHQAEAAERANESVAAIDSGANNFVLLS